MLQVVEIRLKEIEARLKANKKIKIELTDDAKAWLASAGFNPSVRAWLSSILSRMPS